MADVYNAPAVLLIGNDVTQQNPLVAWQIRTGVRHHGLKLYAINSLPSKIHRQAKIAVEVAKGGEHQALRWLASEHGQFDAKTTEALVQLKAALEAEKDVVVLFGADIQGAAIRDLVSLAARFGGKTKFMALGDYANSRGAADMGILPDRLPGYAHLSDSAERARFGKLWGGEISATPGLTARAMMEAAVAGKAQSALRSRRESAEDVWRRAARPAGRPRAAGRARHVPDGNRAARGRGPARRIHIRKRRHAHEHGGRSAIDASLDRSAGPAQRFRFAAHSFAPAQHAGARHAHPAAHARSGVR